MIQILILMAAMYFECFVFMLFVGLGSVHYFSSKTDPSSQSIDEFNKRLPAILRKLYGFDGNYGDISVKRLRFTGMFEVIFGGSVSVLFIILHMVQIFRYDDVLYDFIIVIFMLLEIATFAYLVNLGPMLARIERSRQDEVLDGDS